MYYVYWQEQNKIEIVLSGKLTREEFIQVIHQLESLCAMYTDVAVLLDASEVTNYAVSIVLDEYDFYKKYNKHLARVAIVSDKKFESYLLGLFNKFSSTKFEYFPSKEIASARKWIFPSRLPA